VQIVGNWATRFGGAVCADSRGTLTLVNCQFTDNGASNGAAMASEEIDVTMTGCAFEGMSPKGRAPCTAWAAPANGSLHVPWQCLASVCYGARGRGAVGMFGTKDAAIVGCRFERNSANAGGAVWSDANVPLRECVFSGNFAQRGGAIFGLYGSVIRNCVFAGNRARWEVRPTPIAPVRSSATAHLSATARRTETVWRVMTAVPARQIGLDRRSS